MSFASSGYARFIELKHAAMPDEASPTKTEGKTGPSRRAVRHWLLAGLAVLVFGLAYRFGPGIKEFLAVDKCLDLGGKWDYDNHTCLYK